MAAPIFVISNKKGVSKVNSANDCDLYIKEGDSSKLIHPQTPVTSIAKAVDLTEVLYKYMEIITAASKKSLDESTKKHQKKVNDTNTEVFMGEVFTSLESKQTADGDIYYDMDIAPEYEAHQDLIVAIMTQVSRYQTTVGKRISNKMNKK